MTTTLRIASAQYPIGYFNDWASYQQHIELWVKKASSRGANLLVFPEYFSMELASLFDKKVQQDLHLQIAALQDVLDDFRTLFKALCLQHSLYIQAGTFPVRLDDGSFRNRAFLFGPEGELGFQDKLQMTRFENEQWFIQAGDAISLLETRFGKIAISTCYDSEFPLIARAQVERGANLMLVPSCTDTLAGYHRVRIGCQARALENQCFVVQAVTIGDAPWSPAVDENNGAAAVYSPVDYGFPANGIISIGELNKPGWVYADVDLASIEEVRKNGQVFNYRDWDKQQRVL